MILQGVYKMLALFSCVAAAWLGLLWRNEVTARKKVIADFNIERLALAKAKEAVVAESFRKANEATVTLRKVENAYSAELSKQQVTVAHLRSQLDSLRDATDFAVSGGRGGVDTVAACRADAAIVGGILKEAFGEAVSLAKEADRHAGEVRVLKDYAEAVKSAKF
jgi:hypothetical protein